jgi:hypothetical protein
MPLELLPQTEALLAACESGNAAKFRAASLKEIETLRDMVESKKSDLMLLQTSCDQDEKDERAKAGKLHLEAKTALQSLTSTMGGAAAALGRPRE